MTDTVKHMWDEVEKARADGTFSSEHAAVPAQSDAASEVQDTWLVGGEDLKAMSGSIDSDRVIQLHFKRRATDKDREWLLKAINAQIKADREAASLTPAEGDTVPVPKAALAWLFGEDAAPDGRTFGEDEDAEIATPRKYTRRYWWRSRFRSMIPALSQQHSSTMLTPEETK